MCYGMSTVAVRWLAYEMVEKNNIKDMMLRVLEAELYNVTSSHEQYINWLT